MKKNLLLLIGFMLCLISSAQEVQHKYSTSILFQSGFEEGNKAIWDDWDGNPDTENQIISDPGPYNKAGNHVIRLFVPSGERGSSDLVKVLPEQYDSLYVRWFQKYEPGFNFNAPNHGSGLFAGNRVYLGQSDNRPNGDDFVSSTLEYDRIKHSPQLYVYYRGMYQDCANPVGSCWGDHFPCTSDEGEVYCTKAEDRDPPMPPVLSAGTWYCFEMKLKLGTPSSNGSPSNGELAFWVDGNLCGAWKNLWMRNTNQLKINILWLLLFHHDGTHSSAGILIDDVVVSTSPVGHADIASTGHRSFSETAVKVFPNPAGNSVIVRLPEYRKFSIMIYDMNGKLLITEPFDGTEGSIDTGRLDHGVYNLMVKDESNNSLTTSGKLICK